MLQLIASGIFSFSEPLKKPNVIIGIMDITIVYSCYPNSHHFSGIHILNYDYNKQTNYLFNLLSNMSASLVDQRRLIVEEES